ncbi:FRAS1-related extracellular matrix protein 1 [Patella vulgata]|uniref:FRAS1-related extracellular matrix protein 1 n=1 Tax=Patella vulgata TaxID=6465 RepID=UPI0024A86867|nr:FRAS1-related extracellular matrix protein 1 [Patella vulgata]
MASRNIIRVFLLIFVPVYGSLLLDKRDITVNVGRSVFLERPDLVFVKGGRDEECRVEVVNTDPMTQRVGKLEPTIFDCHFSAKTIKYIHNGSPLLSKDEVKLRVHRFTSTATQTETVYLTVRIVNASNEVFMTQGLRPVVVPGLLKLSNTIDGSVLRFRHSNNKNGSCTVGFSRYHSHWPIAGQMTIGKNRQTVDAVRKDCREFLYMNLHYEHLRSPIPDVDYLPLTVELFDPSISEEVITEMFYLPIYIKGAIPNSPPRSSDMSLSMMDVDQFVLSTIIPGIIQAEDYETPNSQLVFNISKNFGDGKGYFVNINDQSTQITSFYQDDLDNHRIAYRPPNVSYTTQRHYEAELVVFDSHFASSMPITLHVAVRPSSTSAPRVSHNHGLVLLEGQTRPITVDDLQIVDRDNLEGIRVYVKGGVRHGTLTVNGKQSIMFRPVDLRNGQVMYVHDDSDSTKDEIGLRINDGIHTVLATFPITIIPKDDTPPNLVNNLGFHINQGKMKKISDDVLLAHDDDSLDYNIIYTLTDPPKAGIIVRKLRSSNTETTIFGFRQRDILKGQVYYKHNGKDVFRDTFRFRLQDQHDPPNESDEHEFHILIDPLNENPPQMDTNALKILQVRETDVGYIGQAQLLYTDVESPPRDIVYTITTPPYFVFNTGERDAGYLVATHNLTMVTKEHILPQVPKFTQEDINYLKIAYLPPREDIGPLPRLVRFVYTVEDGNRNKIYGQTFDIEVLPVNNRVPRFTTEKLLVEEGGILGITVNQLSAIDDDTPSEELKFICDILPKYGKLQRDGVDIGKKGVFMVEDLQKTAIRYVHDGSDVEIDTFTLTLTDGVNQATKVITVDIVPIDDKTPRLQKNLRPYLIVSEGSEALLTPHILAATDDDTDDESLVFLIVRQPRYGVLQLKGQPLTKFTQKALKDELISFLHTSGEIGLKSLHDVATFIVSDQNYLASVELPVYDLNITITPVNNQKPTILLGDPVLVSEGDVYNINENVLQVTDLDSKTKEIEFMITKQPQWGFLENIKPSPGSEKSNAGLRINSFTYSDILDRSINYVQSNHRGVEPVHDQFELYATDGKLNSDSQIISVNIIQANDEAPDLMLKDFTIDEGGFMMMDQSMMDAIDLDMPKDSLTMSLSQQPQHGQIVMMIQTRKGHVEAEVQDFTIEELHSGMQLKYKHDGSESMNDKFVVTVSDGKHDIKRVCNVTVRARNDEKPEVIKNAGLQLDYGESGLISSIALQATDDDNGDAYLYYIVVELPKKGILQYCPNPFSKSLDSDCRDIEPGTNFTQKDVDLNKVRYVHTTSMGESETDRFMFVLSDGKYKRHEETFEIRIKNSRKANIALLNRGMEIREGERVAISTNNLSASDESTNAEEIVFAVIRPPRLGKIQYIDQPTGLINSFSQLDLASQKVVYIHLTKTDITEDSFVFTVTNGLSEAKNGEFRIKIQPLDRFLPSLVANNLLEVLQGTEEVITPHHIKATDPDTDALNLTYTIAKPPTYGNLSNRGVMITHTFTQTDIDRGFITYTSDGSRAGLDNFLFTLSDGKHSTFLINNTAQTQPAMSSIFVHVLKDDPPTMIVNKHPEFLEHFGKQKYGYKLNSKVLRAVDSDTRSSNLIYTMVKKPKHGHIQNTEAKRFVRRRFTQKDLDEDSLIYIVNKDVTSTNDSFTFRVEDNRGNELNNQHISFEWSRIEFISADMVACENVGTLSITILRRGALNQMAYVGVQIKEMSAKTGEDFVPSSARQVQFGAGQSRATWELLIKDDGLEETNEKLRLTLVDPINAIIGDTRKLRLRLINSENGECPQYLGMVSSNHDGFLTHADSIMIPSKNSSTGLGDIYHTSNILSKPFKAGDNTYLNTEPKITKKTKKKKKKNKKKNSNNKKKKKKKDVSMQNNFDKSQISPGSPTNHPVCDVSKKGLLRFDLYTQQMFQCTGRKWQVWNAISNNDERPKSNICQQGWHEFDGYCYKYINDKLPWDDAEALCVSTHNGHLTSVRSSKHLKWLGHQARKKSFWIGLNDKQDTGVWKFVSGDPVAITNWKNGRPRVKRMLHKKNCVVVKRKLKWRNKHCDRYTARFICEQSPQGLQVKETKRSRRGQLRGKRQRRNKNAKNLKNMKNMKAFFFK